MKSATGSLAILHEKSYYTLVVSRTDWNVEWLLQYLDDVYRARDKAGALLRMLGYTMRITPSKPPRLPGLSWIEVDLEARCLETNSELIRRAVDREWEDSASPSDESVLRRIHEVLDQHDFTVKLHRR